MSDEPWFCWLEEKDGLPVIKLDGHRREGRLWLKLFTKELKRLEGSLSYLPRSDRKYRVALAIEKFGRRLTDEPIEKTA